MIIRIRQTGKDYDGKNRYIYAINKSKNDYRWGTYRDWETDRKSTRLNSSHSAKSRMPSSA